MCHRDAYNVFALFCFRIWLNTAFYDTRRIVSVRFNHIYCKKKRVHCITHTRTEERKANGVKLAKAEFHTMCVHTGRHTETHALKAERYESKNDKRQEIEIGRKHYSVPLLTDADFDRLGCVCVVRVRNSVSRNHWVAAMKRCVGSAPIRQFYFLGRIYGFVCPQNQFVTGLINMQHGWCFSCVWPNKMPSWKSNQV